MSFNKHDKIADIIDTHCTNDIRNVRRVIHMATSVKIGF